MNRIESENHEIGFYVFHKISLSCFGDEINILENDMMD